MRWTSSATTRRVAYRLIRYLKEERRLETVQEVVDAPLLERGVDAVSSTNAIHLYYDLADTLGSWRELLRPGGAVFVQSGNIGVPDLPAGSWIIDETVEAINDAAVELVRADERYSAYRNGLADDARQARYDELRRKFFRLRPLPYYVDALEAAGFASSASNTARSQRTRRSGQPFSAPTTRASSAGSAARSGSKAWAPTDAAVADRLQLLRESIERVFAGSSFDAVLDLHRGAPCPAVDVLDLEARRSGLEDGERELGLPLELGSCVAFVSFTNGVASSVATSFLRRHHHVPATTPSSRIVGRTSPFLRITRLRVSSSNIRVRSAWARRTLSHSPSRRSGAGVSAGGRGAPRRS